MRPRRLGRHLAVVLCAVTFGLSAPAFADEPVLTRARVAELVRASPAARAARAEAEVARAAVTAADAPSLDNPVLSGMGGLRFNADGTRPFAGTASISWPVDVAGQTGARIEAAEAEHRAAHATADDAQRRALLAALLQHALVLRDERAVALAIERRALADRLLAAAEKRRLAGGVAQVDIALGALQQGRDAAALATAEGTRDADRLVLLALLGQPRTEVPPVVSGNLVPAEEPPSLPTLVAAVDRRSDVRKAASSLDAARARAGRERAARFPTISLVAQYERDDGANIGTFGFAVPLPLLNANRAGVATSSAEVTAAAARLDATRSTAAGETHELHARYVATKRALEALRPTVAAIAEAVSLSTRGYELGENDLASVLLVRREALETQLALLEAEHAHANAKIELLVASGRVPQ